MYSLILCLIVSFLFLYNLHLQFCCVINFCFDINSCDDIICAAISKDSISLLRFSIHSYVQFILRGISPFCRLKYLYICFSSHFCFQLIVAVISNSTICISLLFLMYSSRPRIVASTLSSMLASAFSSTFLGTYLSGVRLCESLSISLAICLNSAVFHL